MTLKRTYQQRLLRLIARIALVMLLSVNAIAQDKGCTDLKKVNNLDELLYQFYVNLDSDCLFTMPISELEEIWGFKILSDERYKTGRESYEARMGPEFDGKPYHSEADAFYVKASRRDGKTDRFYVLITEEYYQTHATLFPEGNYPRLLPPPAKKYDTEGLPHRGGGQSLIDLPRPSNRGEYKKEYIYFWMSTDRTRQMELTPGTWGSVTMIEISNDSLPEYLEYLMKPLY